MEKTKKYYLGLDIGTDSVGYAVTDEKYNLLKFHGDAAWGSTIFDAASLSAERRSFRSARRRLDRRQQRVQLLQEIFAKEISKKDERFFIRLSESYLWREDTKDRYVFFDDAEYTDVQYMSQYPTIHHLICELINNKGPHDVRLVYLACAWLVAHRGHFLSNIKADNLAGIVDIQTVYDKFLRYFEENGYDRPWGEVNVEILGEVLKKKAGVTVKYKELVQAILDGNKPEKTGREEFPFSQEAILKLLAGGQCKLKDIFCNEDYEEFGSVSLGMDEDKWTEVTTNIGDDYELLSVLRGLYDWSVLADILGDDKESPLISEAKVTVYEQHKKDLQTLKYFIKKYCPERYHEIFRAAREDNYVAYSYHTDKNMAGQVKGRADIEVFSKYILKILHTFSPDEADCTLYEEMCGRVELRSFLPKQKNTDNRVIPHQLYEYELKLILQNAAEYLPFLKECDESEISNLDKIMSIFRFKIPYFVGPLNNNSSHAWLSRKAESIRPWNIKDIVDYDESEQAFIQRMTNHCTYLPGEPVLPKDSLCYQRFMVLNEINNLKIDGRKIPVEAKQGIFNELFKRKRKVKKKDILNYLISNGYLSKGNEDMLSGIDEQIKSGLSSYISFRKLIENKILTETDIEKIIERAAYAEDKSRVLAWLKVHYAFLSEEDMKYICKIRVKDFGRLSRRFLDGLEGVCKGDGTGEAITILRAIWEKNNNLMEVLSDKYTFMEEVQANKENYYLGKHETLENRLDDMYISNAVRRSIYRTLDIVKDVTKAFGVPQKIFVEMTRGGSPDQKGKRTKTRRQQILEIYEKCKEEDVRELKKQLESMGEYVDNRLQADRLFLYFMQFGISAYSGKFIQLEKLMSGSKEYDIDHIYPQAYVKDDSIINNKVLVLSAENGAKKDVYPINKEIREQMHSRWEWWRHIGTISEEKYKRLTRSTKFTEDEKYGFINRQLTETSQSTKAIAELLKEKFPDTEIVYTKAGLASDFRHKFDLCKCRSYNDLHHAVDAYLNIVVGNVYHMKFSRQWFKIDSNYSIKTETLFKHQLICGNELVWDGQEMLAKVLKTAKKNTAHFTKYSTFKTGGFFDQMPVKKAEGLIPLKAGLPTEKYGGYNKPGVMFFIPTKYKMGKKSEIMIMSIELLHGKKFLHDEQFAQEYARNRLAHILNKPVEKIEEVSFPLGMRSWKINTILSLDGFRICITGSGSGGKCLAAQPIMQFSTDEFWKYYIRKLENFVEKMKANANYKYDAEYDVVTVDNNIKLYDLYIDKLQNSIYQKRINVPTQTLVNGMEKFHMLSVFEQSQVLLNIQQVFGRMAGGCDLTLIGGKGKSAATVSFSSSISNWKKYYSDVRIIDQSPSGLWEQKSQNLLELL